MCCKVTGQIKLPMSNACEHWGPSPDVAHLFDQTSTDAEPNKTFGSGLVGYETEQEDKYNE